MSHSIISVLNRLSPPLLITDNDELYVVIVFLLKQIESSEKSSEVLTRMQGAYKHKIRLTFRILISNIYLNVFT